MNLRKFIVDPFLSGVRLLISMHTARGQEEAVEVV